MPYGNGTGGYYLPRAVKKPVVTSPYVTPGNRTTPPPPTNANPNMYNPVASANKPGTSAAADYLYANMPNFGTSEGYLRGRAINALQDASMNSFGGYPQLPGQMPMGPGGGGRGGGGGGGAAGPQGLDQATLDWLLGQLGMGKPQGLAYNPLDLPDPKQFFGNFDTSLYDQASQGVNQGIEGIRGRANTAYDAAQQALQNYINPFAGGSQQMNPDYNAAFGAMAAANDAGGQLNQTVGEGAQADRAFANAQALLAGNDQARQAANLRALAGDRTTTEQNLGLEGNMLNLGVNMAKAKGKSAWDQMLAQLGFDTATTEAGQNWSRQNTVGDTNVANRNQYNQSILPLLLQLVGAKAPGTTLPADTGGWYAAA